jgi:hypothetical protein
VPDEEQAVRELQVPDEKCFPGEPQVEVQSGHEERAVHVPQVLNEE